MDARTWEETFWCEYGGATVPLPPPVTPDTAKRGSRVHPNCMEQHSLFPPVACAVSTAPSSFELPYELYYEAQRVAYMDERRRTFDFEAEPSPYFVLDRSIYRTPPTKPEIDVHRCACDAEHPCGPGCWNRDMLIECTSRSCSCGSKCQNRRFTKRQWADCHVRRCGRKGWGLFNGSSQIDKGAFICEYVGEVIDFPECQRRLEEEYCNEVNHYMLTLGSNAIIDATRFGNVGRFTNHSCEPNCCVQKWVSQGKLVIGIFTKQAIEPREELTFDYRFERFGGQEQPCFCGSQRCRKFLGAKPVRPAVKKRVETVQQLNQDVRQIIIAADVLSGDLYKEANRALKKGIIAEKPLFLYRDILRVAQERKRMLLERFTPQQCQSMLLQCDALLKQNKDELITVKLELATAVDDTAS